MEDNKEQFDKPAGEPAPFLSFDDGSKERLDNMASTILQHKDELRDTIVTVERVKEAIAKAKGGKAGLFLNLIDDKSLVIVGVVVIGLVGMWKLTDPTILLTSVISGLFGVATGRGIGDNNNSKKDMDE